MEREWRCGNCGTHHDVERRAWLHLRYRQVRTSGLVRGRRRFDRGAEVAGYTRAGGGAMTPPVTTQDLLPSEVAFVAAMQQLGFGRFEYLQIRGGELVLNPGRHGTRRQVRDARDDRQAVGGHLGLRPQIAEFFAYVREVDAGEIREVEVRHGLPFSMEIELAGEKRRSAGGHRG